jgi:periplasmic divalent cation tolerance protein
MGMRADNIIIVLVTASSKKEAEKIARATIQKKLAACVSILPSVTSIFRWQGKVQRCREALIILKTRSSRYRPLEKAICSMHSYDVPEMITIQVEKGLPQYVEWVIRETTGN